VTETSPVTLKKYYRGFLSLLGLLAAVPPVVVGVVLPFLAGSKPAYGFPPLGEVETFARLGLLCLAFVVTFLVYFWRGGKWPLVAAAITSFACLCLYVALYPYFVLRIDVPSQGTVIHVSVGYDRSEFAKTTFTAESDEDMIRARGMSDEEIKKLWTPSSLITARLALFMSYSCIILGLVAVFSFGILFDRCRTTTNPP
jgi:hypothetical protein